MPSCGAGAVLMRTRPRLCDRYTPATFLSASQTLVGAIGSELAKGNVATRQMLAPLPPLNHIAFAAVAVEVAPPASDVNQLNSPAYQEQVAAAVAAGVARARQGSAP